ncbi:CBU_0592 family membrane protein [Curtobacterium citreum]
MLVGIVEFLGWFGAVTVLAGYLLFSLGKIPNGPLYQVFNLVGGLSVAINVAAHHAIPSTIVNGIWAVVAVVVLVRMGRARRARARAGRTAVEPAVLHAEPPTTTAVLPVVGPALRDHEVQPHTPAQAEPRLQTESAPTVPITGSIPVITATIALALVAAANEQAAQDQATQEQEQATQEQDQATQERDATAQAPTPVDQRARA